MTARLTTLALLVALGALSGCSAIPGADPFAAQARSTAEGVNDDLMGTALVHICYGASVGAVRREFGVSIERSELYHALCETPGAVLPVDGGS